MSTTMFITLMALISMATLAGSVVGAALGMFVAGALKMEMEGLSLAYALTLAGGIAGFVGSLYWSLTYV